MKNKGIGALAEQIASKGRNGDSLLMHIQPEELAGIAALLGQDVTINPETGMPEAFSWKKLLGAIGMGAAGVGLAIATGGTGVAPWLMALSKAAVPALISGAAGLGVGAFAPDQKKQDQQALSDQRKYIEDMNKREHKRQIFDVTPGPAMRSQPQGGFSQGIAAALPMGLASQVDGYAEGGKLEPEEEKAQQIIRDAMDAIRGEGDDPETALNTYLAYYGKDALQDLYKRMSGENEQESEEEPEDEEPKAEGMVKGPGNGMDDMATARMAHGGQKVLLSNDEFIIPADVVSGLGDGSSEAGARKLYAMMDRVRMDRTGTKKQPGKIKDGRVLPA